MALGPTILFTFLLITPSYAPDEPSTSGNFLGSCPPKTKRRRISSDDQTKRCFVAEFGIDLKKPCSGDSPEALLKLADFTGRSIVSIDGVDGSGVVNEADLILSRAGIFDWRQQPLEQMYVCKDHYQILGRKFRKMKQSIKINQNQFLACTAPHMDAMGNKHKAGTKIRAVQLYISKEHAQVMMEKHQVLVPTGDGKLLWKKYNASEIETRNSVCSCMQGPL